ncbi:MAG: hypothetical protein HRT68_04755 [Flavobacteriaceae bacterium]|nr:hypothetical protein [Flavobacteriaceae bacterium]
MIKKLIYITVLLISSYTLAQSTDENYVHTTTYTSETQTGSVSEDHKIKATNYYDGLGRPKQSVSIAAGGNKENIIVPVVYDAAGRASKSYLPYASATSNGNFVSNGQVIEDLEDYYYARFPGELDTLYLNPYSYTAVERSALARPIAQAAPGIDWAYNSFDAHVIRSEYAVNALDEVKEFTVDFQQVGGVDNTEAPILVYTRNYPAGELRKTVIKDENWKTADGSLRTTEEFTNKSGQTLLKRTFTLKSGNQTVEALDTYYIYDDFGNLTYVLSPEASDNILNHQSIVSSVLDNLGYQYKYDFRNRLIEKKLPGKGWEAIVYDELDRPVFTQDPNLQAQGKWLFTKYDVMGRVAYTGMYTPSAAVDRATLQASVNATSVLHETKNTTATTIGDLEVYYSNAALPTSDIEVLTVNYYDDYHFNSPLVLESSYDMVNLTGATQSNGVITKTGSYGWNSGFNSQEVITGDGYIEFTVKDTDKRMMVGLSSSGLNDFTYQSLDFAIYTGFGTIQQVSAYESGSIVPIPFTTFTVGDRFRIERLGTRIHYKKNGVTFYQSTQNSTGDLTGDASLLDTGVRVENVHIGHTVYEQYLSDNTKGLATGSVVRVLGTSDFIRTITQYDEKGRAIYVASKNEYLQTDDVVKSKYDFVGNVMESTTSHINNGSLETNTPSAVVTVDAFTYDHQNRLLTHTQTIGNQEPEVITDNNYDDLGQLVVKKTGSAAHFTSTTLHNTHRMIQEGNALTKTNSAAFDGNIESVDKLVGDGYVEFTVTDIDKRAMIGLSNPNEPLSYGYTKIDHAIYIGYATAGNRVSIYEEGTHKYPGAVTYEAGDVFRVHRTGDVISYQKNGIEFYSTTNVFTGDMILDASFADLGTYVTHLRLVTLNPNIGQNLQTVDYTYNIRGWLKEINDTSQSLTNDVFAFKINYNTTETGLGADQLYNGNISETIWKTASSDELQGYGYTYDEINRIATGKYGAGGGFTIEKDFYNLNSIRYDKNGNILTLNRNGGNTGHTAAATMDDLVYGYADNSNQLMRVTDNSVNAEGFNDKYINDSSNSADNDYLYDVNGNMTMDKNKHISLIEYNHLNLPTKVFFENQISGLQDNVIEYVYDATGIKQAKYVTTYNGVDNEVKGTHYAGNFVLEGVNTSNTNPSGISYALQFFNHPEGYVEPDIDSKGAITFRYVYQMKDHLGNIRVGYSDYDGDGVVDIYRNGVDIDGDFDDENDLVQIKSYYPFGLQIQHAVGSANTIVNGRDHKYGFGGKEYQDELNLAWYDIHARNYDAALGRWMNIDPLAEKMVEWSPYNYSFDNPIRFTDPDGRNPIVRILARGRKYYKRGKRLVKSIKRGSIKQGVKEFVIDELKDTGLNAISPGLSEAKDAYDLGKAFKKGVKWLYKKATGKADDVVEKAGKIVFEDGASFANDGEKKIANLLSGEGKTVKVLKESTEEGVKSADYMVDGVKTELKTISDMTSDDLSTALKRRMEKAGKQAGNLIIDVTDQKGASEEIAKQAINRAFGSTDKLKSIRVIGDGFDITKTSN